MKTELQLFLLFGHHANYNFAFSPNTIKNGHSLCRTRKNLNAQAAAKKNCMFILHHASQAIKPTFKLAERPLTLLFRSRT